MKNLPIASNRTARVALACLACAALAWAGSGWLANAEEAKSAAAPPGKIEFTAGNSLTTAHGSFKSWQLTKVAIDKEAPEKSVVELEVDVASIDTGIEKRDKHLRTADFFDVEKFPKATIAIHDAAAKEKGGSVYKAKMDLDIHGVKKTLDVEFEAVARDPLKVKGTVTFNRSDFGVGAPRKWYNPGSIKEAVTVSYEATIEPPPAK